MIYLDNSATTFLYDEVLKKMNYIYEMCNYNPSSAYNIASLAEKELKNARTIISKSINASDDEIVFTSGGSESNNMAVLGIARANKNKGRHIISSYVEHSSVYKTLEYLRDYEGFDISFLYPDKYGTISPEDVKNAMRKDTILVSLTNVNNETGAINDIKNIGDIIKKVNNLTYFHVDCVQSYMKLPLDVKKLNIDLISTSSHKVHGAKGSGFLYVKKNTKIIPLIFGGSQEKNLRAGTENVAGICGFAKAVEISQKYIQKIDEIRKLRDYLADMISNNIKDVRINTPKFGAPHILSLSFAGIKSEILLHYLEMDSIYVSAGSACSSKKKGSRVMEYIKLDDKYKEGTVRISLCIENTKEDMDTVFEKLEKYVDEIRKVTKYRG